MTFAVAVILSCLVRDSGPAIDAWLRGLGMAPASTAYSERFERQAVLWRGGDRYAIVMPDRGRACVIDMGRDWLARENRHGRAGGASVR